MAAACLAGARIASADERPSAPHPPGEEWLLVDAQDGAVLAAHGANREVAIGSTTKLMTAYLARRELPLGRVVTAPPYHPLPGESLMGLRPGEQVSVRSLLYGLLLPSGNDAALTLADAAAGSEPDFVAEMNEAARRLALHRTHYANPIGLDDPGNYSTARDLAHLALVDRRDPVLRRIMGTAETTVSGAHPERLENVNDLLERVPWINGVKTGYTAEAGDVLVASGTQHGVSLVSVLLGAPSEAARDDGTLDLLEYGFSLYRRRTLLRPGQHLGSVSLAGEGEEVPVAAGAAVHARLRRGEGSSVHLRAPRQVSTTLRRGERIGSAAVTVEGRLEGRVPAVAARALRPEPSQSVLARVDAKLPGPRWVVWAAVAAALAICVVVGARLRRRART